MQDTIILIDKLIDDHTQILQHLKESERIVHDVSAVDKLEISGVNIEPGRLGNKMRSIEELKNNLEIIDKGLELHFEREEKALLTALKNHQDKISVSILSVLLDEHGQIKKRIVRELEYVNELLTEELSREVWEGKAYALRSHVSHTARLIGAHAASEHELLQTVRKKISK